MFADTLGQPKAVKLLSRALENGRLAHAYLFSGPEGVGKKTTARQFAATLLCKTGNPAKPCGTCTSCVQYASGNNPDFLHVRPQGAAIKIDQVRELKKALGYPPLEAPRRVILMEDAQTMRREAANSLLKLLEEPPPDNILVLLADDSEPMLQTIISRCQTVPFFPLSLELAARLIAKQDAALTPDSALQLARLSGGCPGLAKSLNSEGLMETYDQIINALPDSGAREADLVETALGLAMQANDLKEGLDQLLDLLRLFFREAMRAGLPGSQGQNVSTNANLLRARERWNLEQLSDKVQVIDFVAKTLARNCNRQTACEVLFLKLMK